MPSNQWTTLNCRLTTARDGCSAAAIHDRYIVIMGGNNGGSHSLSSVDIVDTALQNNHTVSTGPSMTVARAWYTSTVVGHRIFVVGGSNGSSSLTSVESLEFQQPLDNGTKGTATSTIFPSSWTPSSDLVLSIPRHTHTAVTVGSCIVVAGGNSRCKLVEVIDTERNIVWNLPQMTVGRNGCSMAAVSNGIALIGGNGVDTSETIPLMDRKEHLKVRLQRFTQYVYMVLVAHCPSAFYPDNRACIHVERNSTRKWRKFISLLNTPRWSTGTKRSWIKVRRHSRCFHYWNHCAKMKRFSRFKI